MSGIANLPRIRNIFFIFLDFLPFFKGFATTKGRKSQGFLIKLTISSNCHQLVVNDMGRGLRNLSVAIASDET